MQWSKDRVKDFFSTFIGAVRRAGGDCRTGNCPWTYRISNSLAALLQMRRGSRFPFTNCPLLMRTPAWRNNFFASSKKNRYAIRLRSPGPAPANPAV